MLTHVVAAPVLRNSKYIQMSENRGKTNDEKSISEGDKYENIKKSLFGNWLFVILVIAFVFITQADKFLKSCDSLIDRFNNKAIDSLQVVENIEYLQLDSMQIGKLKDEQVSDALLPTQSQSLSNAKTGSNSSDLIVLDLPFRKFTIKAGLSDSVSR